MGVTLTDVLLFGKAQLADVDKATLVICRRNILRWSALGGYLDIIVKGVSPLSLPDAVAGSLSYVKAFGGTEQRNLPAGYTELEYIQSTGTQYIDTGMVVPTNYKWELKLNTRGSNTSPYWGYTNNNSYSSATSFYSLGANGSTGISGITISVGAFSGTSESNQSSFYNATQIANAGTLGGDAMHTIKCNGNFNFTADDTPMTQITAKTFTAFTPGGNAYLFARNAPTMNSGAMAKSGTRIYSYKVWNASGTLVQDLVPAKRNSDNVIGMYDTVSGEFFTNGGTGDFVAGPDVVPTPDAPMDIVSNNGVLKVRHQSGLPLGYTLLNYIKSNRNIPLGFYTNQNSEIEAKWYKDGAGAQYVYQANSGSALTNNTTAYATDGGGNWRFGNQTISIQAPLNTDIISIQNKNGVWFNNERQGTYTNVNDFTGDVDFRALGVPTPDNPPIRLSYIKHRQNGVLLGHYVPCVAPDNSIGLYDLIGGVFYTNADATITAGNTVSDPVEIYTDGIVETINVHGKNLFDINTAIKYCCSLNGYPDSITSVGAVSDSSNAQTYAMAVKPNTTYTISKVAGNRLVVAGFKTPTYPSDTAITTIPYTYNGVYEVTTGSTTFTTDSDCVWIIFSVRNNNSTFDEATNIQVERGSTATAYEPYFNGGTATAEMLLKVGDYQDVQSIIDGAVTRNVGVLVLDGTENWTQYSSNNGFTSFYIDNVAGGVMNGICSHFEYYQFAGASLNRECFAIGGTTNQKVFIVRTNDYTTTSLKQYLADQYAAGTPVIVIYPLATSTTESVTGQTLQVQDGDNTLEITQASLGNLEIEAKYQAAVTLTIQEVQDANLDPNVEVTIN